MNYDTALLAAGPAAAFECQYSALSHCADDAAAETLVYTKSSDAATFAILCNDPSSPDACDTHATGALALFADVLASRTHLSATGHAASPRDLTRALFERAGAPESWALVFVDCTRLIVAGRGNFFCPLNGIRPEHVVTDEHGTGGTFLLECRLGPGCDNSFALAVALAQRQKFNALEASALLCAARASFSDADALSALFVEHLVRDSSFCVFSLLARRIAANSDVALESLRSSPRRSALKVLDSESSRIPCQHSCIRRRIDFDAQQTTRSRSDSGSASMSL